MFQCIIQVIKAKLIVIVYQIVTSHDFSDRGAGNANRRRAGITECQWTLTFHLSRRFGYKPTNLRKILKKIFYLFLNIPPTPQLTVCLVVSHPDYLPEWVCDQCLLKESVDLSDD